MRGENLGPRFAIANADVGNVCETRISQALYHDSSPTMFANNDGRYAVANVQDGTHAIEFYFDPISPFAYLGSIQIERIAARLNRAVEWKPVLIGVTILKVMGLKPLPETPLKGPYLKHDAVRLAEYFDVPFRYHGLAGINSLAALRAFVVLKERDASLAKSLAQKVFSRLWVRGLDITRPDDISGEAKDLGIDVHALLHDIETSHAKNALKEQVDAAIQAGVFGVPYFVIDGEPIWGVDRMWMVEHWATHHAWRAADNLRGRF